MRYHVACIDSKDSWRAQLLSTGSLLEMIYVAIELSSPLYLANFYKLIHGDVTNTLSCIIGGMLCVFITALL
jgi:hypothetical protein